ncbi:uncharacterized protein BKCO1_1000496 [Diplodia corticola]|uniref:Uncharacterized protein n=1 Tax=Diplodia corticola TaxID=236234 RepID=A0A1J9SIW1_9PEZI|nr:uncharacterized protein BKCO1_1000496 [Diplodia corticola]OJD40295.1 hypothetical protein BKCO1_1000496 [Diplodia corticola]
MAAKSSAIQSAYSSLSAHMASAAADSSPPTAYTTAITHTFTDEAGSTSAVTISAASSSHSRDAESSASTGGPVVAAFTVYGPDDRVAYSTTTLSTGGCAAGQTATAGVWGGGWGGGGGGSNGAVGQSTNIYTSVVTATPTLKLLSTKEMDGQKQHIYRRPSSKEDKISRAGYQVPQVRLLRAHQSSQLPSAQTHSKPQQPQDHHHDNWKMTFGTAITTGIITVAGAYFPGKLVAIRASSSTKRNSNNKSSDTGRYTTHKKRRGTGPTTRTTVIVKRATGGRHHGGDGDGKSTARSCRRRTIRYIRQSWRKERRRLGDVENKVLDQRKGEISGTGAFKNDFLLTRAAITTQHKHKEYQCEAVVTTFLRKVII